MAIATLGRGEAGIACILLAADGSVNEERKDCATADLQHENPVLAPGSYPAVHAFFTIQ
jgi:hypothetical protein